MASDEHAWEVFPGPAQAPRPEPAPRHGTLSGARRHVEAGEEPCDACRAAKAEYDERYRSGTDQQTRNRLHAQAQSRARTALAKRYPEEYRSLYAAFKAELFEADGLSSRARPVAQNPLSAPPSSPERRET